MRISAGRESNKETRITNKEVHTYKLMLDED